MNEPYLISTSLPVGSLPSEIAKSEKLMPPMIFPSAGMIRSPTNEDTILPNAAPMITPTARSTTLPFIANSLNSPVKLMAPPYIHARLHVTEPQRPGQALELCVQAHCSDRHRTS